jgi:hypothetical protein
VIVIGIQAVTLHVGVNLARALKLLRVSTSRYLLSHLLYLVLYLAQILYRELRYLLR